MNDSKPPTPNPEQTRLMKRALRLARLGRGRASPNPLVGCVVAKRGEITGEGFHTFSGVKHAEVLALEQAGPRARDADLYVNLEPCCHHGRTPPCVERIVDSGVRRVFVAVRDPNPLVAGRGIERLRQAGVEVYEGLLSKEAERLNEAFFHFIQTGHPFVLLKLAMTLDGKIATSTGHSHWITSERARRQAHRLRYEYDAILVGIETLLADDPSLTVRWRKRNQLTRIILDSNLRTPPKARIFESSNPVLIFHRETVAPGALLKLQEKAELVAIQANRSGLAWGAILGELGRRQVTSLLLEGGSRVAASALAERAVQKACFFYAPKIIGGSGLSGIGDLGVRRLDRAAVLKNMKLRSLAPDFMLEAYLE